MQERIDDVQQRIQSACHRVHRAPEEVTLVAVSKKFPPEVIREAADCGLIVFGENRVQEAAQKIPEAPGHLDWHLIGHLQSNKVKFVPGLFSTVHSVDSEKLFRRLDRAAAETGQRLQVFIQVNVSGEAAKFGCPPEALDTLLEDSGVEASHLDICGLMTMPPLNPDPEATRPHFARLRELRDATSARTGFPLENLSMGMSHDFEVAIEEGATHVRVGTGIFGGRSA